MHALLSVALSNVLVAALLAVPASLAGLRGTRPALTHALWLLVLLKLVTPPLVTIELPWTPAFATTAVSPQQTIEAPPLAEDAPEGEALPLPFLEEPSDGAEDVMPMPEAAPPA